MGRSKTNKNTFLRGCGKGIDITEGKTQKSTDNKIL